MWQSLKAYLINLLLWMQFQVSMLTLFWKTHSGLPSHLYINIVKLFFSAFLRTNRIARNRKNENWSTDVWALLILGRISGYFIFKKSVFYQECSSGSMLLCIWGVNLGGISGYYSFNFTSASVMELWAWFIMKKEKLCLWRISCILLTSVLRFHQGS